MVVLYRRDKNGALQFDWLYLEYEETSSPAKKFDTLREYARFYWSGEFRRLFNTQYRQNYELGEADVQNPRFRTLILVANSEGSGYLDAVLAELRFTDIGVDYKQLGFPSDRMGLHQFLFCQRETLVKAQHALSSVWLNAANYERDKRPVTCIG